MEIKRSHLKSIISEIVQEAIGSVPRLTPAQQKVVELLTKRSFRFVKQVPVPGGNVDVILERPWGKGRYGGPRYARVSHDGTINNDPSMDVVKYLSVVGEAMSLQEALTTRAELDRGVMKAVNVGEGIGEEATPEEIEQAKIIADKVWKGRVKSVYPYPARSGSKFFRVNVGVPDAVWVTKLANGSWLHSEGDKMVPVKENVSEIQGTRYFSELEVGDYFRVPGYDDLLRKIADNKAKNFGSKGLNKPSKLGKKGQQLVVNNDLMVNLTAFEEQTASGAAGAFATKNAFKEGKGNERYWMRYTKDNMVAQKKGDNLVQLLKAAKNLGLDDFAIYRNAPGFHSTTQTDFLVCWMDKSGVGYLSNIAKKDKNVRSIRISTLDSLPSEITEMTSSGAAGGQPGGTIRVPAWGTKNKEGSPRAIGAMKRMKGWKVVKSISEEVK